MLKKVCLILFLYFYLFLPLKIYAADVVFNEIFANPEGSSEGEEFVELYNNTNSEISLLNWKLSDKLKTYILPDLTISGKGFLVLERETTKIILNNSNEELKLTDSTDKIIDSFSYGDTTEEKSWSRVPDGTGSFTNNTEVTKGKLNAPVPTPTPTNTPTPTKTPTTVNTVAPTSNVGLVAYGSSPILEPSGLKSNTGKTYKRFSTSTPGSVLGKGSDSINGLKDNSDEMTEESKNSSWKVFVTGGVGFIISACGILLYRKYKDRKEEEFQL